ncbi:MAG: RnfABCDGE type electron transport complex subunit D [bacterium]
MQQKDSNILIVDTSPHIFIGQTTESIMRDVVIALIPAAVASFFFFGIGALIVLTVSIIGCLGTEWIFCLITKRPNTLKDTSALVTALLFAFCLPSSIPWPMVLFGSVVSILIGKLIFGGLGFNLFNPALVGRAVLMASWPQEMTTWPKPGKIFLGAVDTLTQATPLADLKGYSASYMDLFLGNCGGSLGETSALALLIGGLYLVFRGVIELKIPMTFIGTVFVFSFILKVDPIYSILAGGVFLGAIFMATDYVTSPITSKGKIIFGIGCGILTVLIRAYGGFPEGVCYAILFMNGLVPLIDKFTQPKIFGT